MSPRTSGAGKEGILKIISSVTFLLYFSQFLSAWGDRMWKFAIAMFLIQISPDSLQLTATYGLVSGGAILLLAPLLGRWVDQWKRLLAARGMLLFKNVAVIGCAVLIGLLLVFGDWANGLWDGWLVKLWHAGIILIAVLANLASLGNKISVQRDWIVEICGREKDQLATMGAILRRIDLATKIIAPIITGQVMTLASPFVGAIFIIVWKVISTFLEYFLLRKVYNGVPALGVAKTRSRLGGDGLFLDGKDMFPYGSLPEGHTLTKCDDINTKDLVEVPETKTNQVSNQASHMDNSVSLEGKKEELCTSSFEGQGKSTDNNRDSDSKESCCGKKGDFCKVYGPLVMLFGGWKTYVKYEVCLAGIALACLYLTVLGFDNITTGYAFSQGLSEGVLGGLMGGGALIGIAGTFVFTRIRRRVGLVRTGWFSFSAQILCLTLCVASIWAPGSPFDPFSSQGIEGIAINRSCHVLNQTVSESEQTTSNLFRYNVTHQSTSSTQRNWPTSNPSNTTVICTDERVKSFVSIGMLLGGIITARFGLWITDLTITLLMLENIVETERGVVNGVQSSLNQLMDFLKFALVVALPRPEVFGILVLISFTCVSTGGLFYVSYSRKVRHRLLRFEKGNCATVHKKKQQVTSEATPV